MWLATAFDNMIILLAMLDYASVLNYSGLSSIKPSGLWATIMIWMIIAFNHFIGLESIKCILQVLDEKGNLPQMLKRPLKLMQRFL
jgi:hypothetical protein